MFVVWTPVHNNDNGDEAARASAFGSDPRVACFWDVGGAAPAAFTPALGIRQQDVWSVHLLYGPGVLWEDAPPKPRWWAHQHDHEVGAGAQLDFAALNQEITDLLLR